MLPKTSCTAICASSSFPVFAQVCKIYLQSKNLLESEDFQDSSDRGCYRLYHTLFPQDRKHPDIFSTPLSSKACVFILPSNTHIFYLYSTKMAPISMYSKDEKVLCFHHEILYDAKILDVRHKDSSDKKSPFEYQVHYKGWKNT